MARLRILFGMVLLIVLLGVYALLVMSLAVRVLPDQTLVEIVYYLVTGTIWIYPAAKLTRWMQDVPE
jgi:hypothetical protein